MKELETSILEDALSRTHLSDFDKFKQEKLDAMSRESTSFYTYIKDLMADRGITQQETFLMADISERYGYKLLSGEKHTRQRDVILRICYAAKLTLDETQRALRKYEMPELYVKNERDALIMIAFNERPGGIIEVNQLLKDHGMEPLRSSGVQE